jgi:phenylacetic acid degradation operon negative regulatory protein
MKKSLTLTQILLLSLAGLLDFFEEMKDPANLFSNYYQNFYGFVPSRWKKSNLRSLIYQSKKDGLIQKSIYEKTYKLTGKGFKKIREKFPLLDCKNRAWDKKWRIAFFDVQEIRKNLRSALRKRLKEIGFVMLQKSVWISPHPVFSYLQEWIEERNFSDKIIFVESERLFPHQPQWLIDKFWRVTEINAQYQTLYLKLQKIEKDFKTSDKKKLKKQFNIYYQEGLRLILADPGLPKEFLPSDWILPRLVDLLKKLRNMFLN